MLTAPATNRASLPVVLTGDLDSAGELRDRLSAADSGFELLGCVADVQEAVEPLRNQRVCAVLHFTSQMHGSTDDAAVVAQGRRGSDPPADHGADHPPPEPKRADARRGCSGGRGRRRRGRTRARRDRVRDPQGGAVAADGVGACRRRRGDHRLLAQGWDGQDGDVHQHRRVSGGEDPEARPADRSRSPVRRRGDHALVSTRSGR